MGIVSVAVQDALFETLPLVDYGYWLVRGRNPSDAGFILPAAGSSLRRRVESEVGKASRVVAEVASLEAVPDLVRSGVGEAILPDSRFLKAERDFVSNASLTWERILSRAYASDRTSSTRPR